MYSWRHFRFLTLRTLEGSRSVFHCWFNADFKATTDVPYQVGQFPSIPSLLRIFIMEPYLTLSRAFSPPFSFCLFLWLRWLYVFALSDENQQDADTGCTGGREGASASSWRSSSPPPSPTPPLGVRSRLEGQRRGVGELREADAHPGPFLSADLQPKAVWAEGRRKWDTTSNPESGHSIFCPKAVSN